MTTVITGASGGIGQALARAFSEEGHAVALCCCHHPESAVELATELREAGRRAEPFWADLADETQVKEMFGNIRDTFGEVDLLINNAGVSSQQLLPDVTVDEYDRIMDTNLKGAFLCIREVLPSMIRRKAGNILNISSMWGQVGGSCEVVYSASKAGLIGMTKALAKEVGPSGVRVNCIAPGVIDTPMNAMHSEETMAELAEETPLGRIGTPEDIADAALFLASDRASFLTGQVLGVNGGMVI
ncbi:MAG: SDR family oxidoreductase [Clostridia bacterium]|nr:SDR family oxidoreductase [Clostridia bacterium]